MVLASCSQHAQVVPAISAFVPHQLASLALFGCDALLTTQDDVQVGYIDDRFGPYGLATAVVCALTAILILSSAEFVGDLRKMSAP